MMIKMSRSSRGYPLLYIVITLYFLCGLCTCEYVDKVALKQQAYDMFMHGYRSYMDHAYPADELMPLSCKGRERGVTPSRGDVDDSLGNFSLTLIDTLDTLVVIGDFDEFERAVKLVVENVRFDSDLIVSVFETNIRVLGGLLSGHLMAEMVRAKYPNRLRWYTKSQLLSMATDIGDRLLPAFNTTSGLPFSRINLRYGMLDHLKRQKDTCTACGGTMLLEMAALSRLTGNPIYEQKAKKAMDFLWAQRHRASDLMGTVLNVHSGDWVRKDSGIGAGIDSYYEYCLKAYILLGDDDYLERFNKHYDAVMRYVNKGPLFVDVHMHRPTVATRSFMDALLAFWPGLQVLKGDVKEAIEMHEMLFQVVKKHKFLPEAFTHDFQVHWGEHPLRPEFIESTYFLYRATKDPHYLTVAKHVMESINEYVKVPCGFAGVKDVRTMAHEDRMDSFVLSETFKYLYMIFAEPSDLIFDPDDYVLTTEAHFLPLTIGNIEGDTAHRRVFIRADDLTINSSERSYVSANPVEADYSPTDSAEALKIRERTKGVLEEMFTIQQQAGEPICVKPSERLRAWAFSAANAEHIKQLREMGIDITTQDDGRMHLSHHSANAISVQHAQMGVEFMSEMMKYAERIEKEASTMEKTIRILQIVSAPFYGSPLILAAPAHFGVDIIDWALFGRLAVAEPFRACRQITNAAALNGRIAVVERSDCMFQEKARYVQQAGAIGMIVIDSNVDTTASTQQPFAMAGDKDSPDDIAIPAVFIYHKEGMMLINALKKRPDTVVRLGEYPILKNQILLKLFKSGKDWELLNDRQCLPTDGQFITINPSIPSVVFNFRFEGVTQDSDPEVHQEIVERHVTHLQDTIDFELLTHRSIFFNLLRTAAYGSLGLNVTDEEFSTVKEAVIQARMLRTPPLVYRILKGHITRVRCSPKDSKMKCVTLA